MAPLFVLNATWRRRLCCTSDRQAIRLPPTSRALLQDGDFACAAESFEATVHRSLSERAKVESECSGDPELLQEGILQTNNPTQRVK